MQLRASQQEIETQQEQTLRQAELDQVLGRISHETGVPRAAVRTSIATGGRATRQQRGRELREPVRPAAKAATGAQPPQEEPRMLTGPPTQPAPQEPLQLPDRPPQGSLLTPAPPVPASSSSLLGPISRAVELWPEVRQHDFGFGRDYQYQQEQARALEDAVQMQALAVAGNYRDARFHNLLQAGAAADRRRHPRRREPAPRPAGPGLRQRQLAGLAGSRSQRRLLQPLQRADGGEADSEDQAAPSSRARCSSRCGRCSSTASRPCGLLLATS
jgi:hypothetical protein